MSRTPKKKKSHVDGEKGLQGEERAGFCDWDHTAWEIGAVAAKHPSHED